MATDPNDIRLREDEKRRIAGIANAVGKDWSDLLLEMIDSAEAVLGIEKGLESARKGEGIHADQVHARMRDKYDL